jgi:hypothetical protein
MSKYRGLCERCRHAFNGGPGIEWTDDRPHHCTQFKQTTVSQAGAVETCTEFQAKRHSAAKG